MTHFDLKKEEKMPPPCSSYNLGSITDRGMVTSNLTKNGWAIGGTLSGEINGLSPAGCAPYRTKFNFLLDYTLYIYVYYYASRNANPSVSTTEFSQTLDLGTVDGTGNIGNNANYHATSDDCDVKLSGGATINFQSIYNALSAYHSDPVPNADNIPYTTYELHSAMFVPRMLDYIGHGDPFSVDVPDSMSASSQYLPT